MYQQDESGRIIHRCFGEGPEDNSYSRKDLSNFAQGSFNNYMETGYFRQAKKGYVIRSLDDFEPRENCLICKRCKELMYFDEDGNIVETLSRNQWVKE